MSTDDAVLLAVGELKGTLDGIKGRLDSLEQKVDLTHGLDNRIVALETQVKLGRWLLAASGMIGGGAVGGHFI